MSDGIEGVYCKLYVFVKYVFIYFPSTMSVSKHGVGTPLHSQ